MISYFKSYMEKTVTRKKTTTLLNPNNQIIIHELQSKDRFKMHQLLHKHYNISLPSSSSSSSSDPSLRPGEFDLDLDLSLSNVRLLDFLRTWSRSTGDPGVGLAEVAGTNTGGLMDPSAAVSLSSTVPPCLCSWERRIAMERSFSRSPPSSDTNPPRDEWRRIFSRLLASRNKVGDSVVDESLEGEAFSIFSFSESLLVLFVGE